MSDGLTTLFFLFMIVLIYLIFKYLNAIDNALKVAPDNFNDKSGLKKTKIHLLVDFRFIVSIYTRSYVREYEGEVGFVEAMNKVRRYLLLQYPLAVFIFLMPIISRIIEG